MKMCTKIQVDASTNYLKPKRKPDFEQTDPKTHSFLLLNYISGQRFYSSNVDNCYILLRTNLIELLSIYVITQTK